MHRCIEIHSLDCHFGTRAALQDINLAVAPGEIHALLGPTGAGKTTLLRVLVGELEPSRGRALVPEHVTLVTDDADGISPLEALLHPDTRRRVALARALAEEPDLLLVDEPADGFDGATAAAARSLTLRHVGQGGAVIWAARRLDALHGIASGVTLLVGGRMRYTGTPGALAALALTGLAVPVAAPLGRAA